MEFTNEKLILCILLILLVVSTVITNYKLWNYELYKLIGAYKIFKCSFENSGWFIKHDISYVITL